MNVLKNQRSLMIFLDSVYTKEYQTTVLEPYAVSPKSQ